MPYMPYIGRIWPIPTESSQVAVTSKVDTSKKSTASPAVRFASVEEEIPPVQSLNDTTQSVKVTLETEDAKVQELTKALQGSELQGRRMSCYAYEPLSLPVSRVCIPHILSAWYTWRTCCKNKGSDKTAKLVTLLPRTQHIIVLGNPSIFCFIIPALGKKDTWSIPTTQQ